MKRIFTLLAIILILVIAPLTCVNASFTNNTANTTTGTEIQVTQENFSNVYDCYTLLNPWLSKNTYLINNDGDVVHQWHSDHFLSLSAYLLEDGRLLRTSGMYSSFWWMHGCQGRVEMFDWDGTLNWTFAYSSSGNFTLHHDVEYLPNGHILMTVTEEKTISEAIAAGFNPNADCLYPPNNILGYIIIDYIIEVEPTYPEGGNIVWEWHFWDHIIQDIDPSKDNYGVVADHPELLDINFQSEEGDITHTNTIKYIPEFDQILLSSRNVNEIFVIDHNTTTQEAAGHTGGTYGKGGDFLYRWGNPQNYDAGDANDRQLFRQHDARWVEDGLPSADHITIFNNRNPSSAGEYSSVIEMVPPVDRNGYYNLTSGSAYGPAQPLWNYTADNPTDFYSDKMGGAQRLPNGNTRICEATSGHLFEVTPNKQIVWEYTDPYPLPIPFINTVFKIQCYSSIYSGLYNLFVVPESEEPEEMEMGDSLSLSSPSINQDTQESATSSSINSQSNTQSSDQKIVSTPTPSIDTNDPSGKDNKDSSITLPGSQSNPQTITSPQSQPDIRLVTKQYATGSTTTLLGKTTIR